MPVPDDTTSEWVTAHEGFATFCATHPSSACAPATGGCTTCFDITGNPWRRLMRCAVPMAAIGFRTVSASLARCSTC